MSWFDELRQDLRYGVRSLRANPAFTLVALVTLTLGIGANALIFSIVSGVLLRPLPYASPERLVIVNQTAPSFGLSALGNFREYRSSTTLDLAGYVPNSRAMDESQGPERTGVVVAERQLFRVLGVEAAFGRTFRDDDPTSVLVVGARFARQRFGSEAAALGKTITLEKQPLTIIGVMPEAFQFPYDTTRFPGSLASAPIELWTILELPENRRAAIDVTIGRLKPGITRETARAEMNSIAQRLAAQFPESNTGFGVELTPLADTIVGSVRTQLLVLAGAVALVLLVACANVANLLLTRASTRTREIAVRTAIGAGRLRLIRQFLTESIVLALAGGVLGLIVVYLGTPLLLAIAAPKLPRLTDIGVDWRVFGFLFAVSIVTGITFGLAPALASSRGDVQGTLKGAAGLGGSARFFRRFRDGLAAVEVAMAFVLVIGAGLLVREFGRLRNTETGLQPANVLTMHLMPNMSAEDCYALVPQVQALPGVRTAAFAQMLPLQSWGWTATFSIKGRPPFPPAERPVIELRYVTPGYFDALGIPVRGRAFDDGDGAKSARVIIVNETLARRYLAGLDPIGLETDRGRIVGVAQDVRSAGLDRPTLAEVYYPMIQNYSQVRDLGMSMIISTNVPPETLTAPARDLIRRTHPSLAIFGVRTMEQIVSDSLSETSLYTWLVGSFALLALVLASAGIYGVMSYAVAARTREFGIRFALGADRRGVQRLVLRHAAAVAGVGIGIGLVGMMVSVRFLESLIVGGGRVQPLPVAAAGAVLALVALMASIVPARRAASVDPMGALREE